MTTTMGNRDEIKKYEKERKLKATTKYAGYLIMQPQQIKSLSVA